MLLIQKIFVKKMWQTYQISRNFFFLPKTTIFRQQVLIHHKKYRILNLLEIQRPTQDWFKQSPVITLSYPNGVCQVTTRLTPVDHILTNTNNLMGPLNPKLSTSQIVPTNIGLYPYWWLFKMRFILENCQFFEVSELHNWKFLKFNF